MPIQRDPLADDVRLSSESLLPVLIPQYDRRIRVRRLAFVINKQSSKRRLHVQHREEISSDVIRQQSICAPVDAQAIHANLVACKLGENVSCLAANHTIVRHGKLVLNVPVTLPK